MAKGQHQILDEVCEMSEDNDTAIVKEKSTQILEM